MEQVSKRVEESSGSHNWTHNSPFEYSQPPPKPVSPKLPLLLLAAELSGGKLLQADSPQCSTAVGALPPVWRYQRFCRFLPINVSQRHPSLPVLLLNSYLGTHHLMSQLLQHPFCGHWQTHSCPDGVLIHNAAAKIIPQPGFLFTHLAGSFSFSYQTINWPSLSRTLPLYCSFYSASKGQLSHLNSPQFLLLLITCQLCSLLRLCHIFEKVYVKHYFVVASQPVPRNTFWSKKNFQQICLSWVLVAVCDVLLFRLMLQDRTCATSET